MRTIIVGVGSSLIFAALHALTILYGMLMNKYPLWKYLLVLAVITLGIVYALPNLYAPDPAIQISGESSALEMDKKAITAASQALKKNSINFFGEEYDAKSGLFRLEHKDQQLRAQRVIQQALGHDYVVALNLAPTTPTWLGNLGAGPMKLGLDLSGGVHFLMEVDTKAAVAKRLDGFLADIKRDLRKERIRGVITADKGILLGRFKNDELRNEANSRVRELFPSLNYAESLEKDRFLIRWSISDAQRKEIEDYAVKQNLTTLRNRVNELGVAEPLVQKQGRNRIVVELPGVQDTAEAKRILGKTANLEFRLEVRGDTALSDKEKFTFRNDTDPRGYAWLMREVVISGDRVANATASFDENGRPQVNITLDGQGGKLMHRATRTNIKRNLAVLFIERKIRFKKSFDENNKVVEVKEKYDQKQIISLATIQSALGTQFRITGLDSSQEASELALLLRAGALAAPIEFVEERTVGPSLGAENIDLGVKSVQIGFVLVLVFMLLYYKVFGVAANIALGLNLILLVALMSLLSATLTLPGIAGIVLTVGMAVDANVLIFARIREELAAGVSPQSAINAGYERAIVTIVDANITTLLVAVILYAVGTGPVRGFAVTLSLGIVTSMFTAIMVARAIINLVYGRRRVDQLWI